MKIFLSLLVILITFTACNNKKNIHAGKPNLDSTKFYPLKTFFNEQIVDVDLGAFPIYQIKELNRKRDSFSISKEIFKLYATIFLQKDISNPLLQPNFTESVFHDLSTKSYTLNYRAKTTEEPIQNIDILLDENTNLVKRVFIRTELQHLDTSIVEQCNWKANKSFQINRFSKTSKGYVSNELNYISWNDRKK